MSCFLSDGFITSYDVSVGEDSLHDAAAFCLYDSRCRQRNQERAVAGMEDIWKNKANFWKCWRI